MGVLCYLQFLEYVFGGVVVHGLTEYHNFILFLHADLLHFPFLFLLLFLKQFQPLDLLLHNISMVVATLRLSFIGIANEIEILSFVLFPFKKPRLYFLIFIEILAIYF